MNSHVRPDYLPYVVYSIQTIKTQRKLSQNCSIASILTQSMLPNSVSYFPTKDQVVGNGKLGSVLPLGPALAFPSMSTQSQHPSVQIDPQFRTASTNGSGYVRFDKNIPSSVPTHCIVYERNTLSTILWYCNNACV